MKMRHALAASVCVAALGATAGPASAQTAPARTEQASSDSAMPEILVTARRRAEDVSKIPVAVTAFSSDTLASKQIVNTVDLNKITPGLNIVTSGSNANPFLTIRGQSRGLAGAGAPGVITYLNEVPMLTYGSLIATFDMDNIQVLKGPQGTLFGRNAVGGALLTYSKKPTYNWEGYGEGSYGNFKTLRLEGAVNIPIIKDVLAVRVAGQLSDTNGYTKTIVNAPPVLTGKLRDGTLIGQPGQTLEHAPQMDAYKNKGFRATVLFEPTSTLHNVTTVDYYRIDGMNNEVFTGDFFPGTAVFQLPASVLSSPQVGLGGLLNPLVHCGTSPTCDIDLATAEAKTTGARLQRTDQLPTQVSTVFGVSNATTFDLGPDTTIKNIFGYRTTANDSQVDIDGTALPLVDIANRIRMKQITEELQIAGKIGDLKYVAGGFYLHATPNGIGGFQSTASFIFAGLNAETNANYYTEKSKALYGQIDYDLSNVLLRGLGFTAGFRYTWDEASGCAYSRDYSVTNGGTPPGAGNYGFIPSFDQCKSGVFPADPNTSPAIFDTQGNVIRAATIADNFATKSSAPSWTFALNWQATPDLLLYATTRRGYKAGGYNTPKIFAKYAEGLQNFAPETLTDVELGIKSRFRLGNMPGMFNIDIYQGKDKGFQYYQNVTGVKNLPPNGITFNKADLTIRGVEAELSVKPVPGLTLGLNGSYTQIKVDKVTFPASLNQALIDSNFTAEQIALFSEVTVGNQPKYIANANAEYIVPQFVGGADLRFNVDFHYQSDYTNGQLVVPAWQTTDAQIGLVGLAEGKLNATFWVKNLFDKLYPSGTASSSAGTGIKSYSYAPPRTYGVTLRYKFN